LSYDENRSIRSSPKVIQMTDHALLESNELAIHWAAPHFLVHLKWEFFERSHIDRSIYQIIREHFLLSSQDALNSFGVAYFNELCGRTAL
jgi:hypothetical protein